MKTPENRKKKKIEMEKNKKMRNAYTSSMICIETEFMLVFISIFAVLLKTIYRNFVFQISFCKYRN